MKRKPRKKAPVAIKSEPRQRSYSELARSGGKDWVTSWQTEDAELLHSAWSVIPKTRDLLRSNPLYIAYRETLWANVFGANGILFRATAKEQEDRIVSAQEEKAIERYYERRDKVLAFIAKEQGREFVREQRLTVLGSNGSRVAQIKIGEPAIHANLLIEKGWREWQHKQYCDVRGTRHYGTTRQLRLISAVRDGDFYIHMISDAKVNRFGFTLRLINAEWCDRFYNDTLDNGNIVVMGHEYEWKPWGLGRIVAYHFIKRQEKDWRWTANGSLFGPVGRGLHDRIPAEQIIHYARAVDADATRPAPWIATTIPSSRQRDQAMLAEVVAWREAACKTGFYYSDVNPEGGTGEGTPDPTNDNIPTEELAPGESRGLPWGVKYQERDPTHPNSSVKEFRMASIQDGCAGMPGSNYSTMANDYAAINFSAGRLQRLDTNETNMLLQQFDIDYAETPIFDAWLPMALITGAVPLDISKLEQYNSKVFTGRRWRGVDEVKEANASALRIQNKLASYTSENADLSQDFETIIEQQATERMVMQQYGINPETTAAGKAKQPEPRIVDNTSEKPAEGEEPSQDVTEAASSGEIQGAALNGAQILALLEIVSRVTSGEITGDAASAIIAAAFPLMTAEEINAIVSKLTVKKPATPEASETEEEIDNPSRLELQS